MPRHELVNAVRAAGLGTTVLDAAMSSHLTRTPAGATSAGGVGSLTARERQVVQLVAEGLADKTIANRLGISARTIEGHLNHIFAKLGVTSRTELVRFALSNNLADAPDPWGLTTVADGAPRTVCPDGAGVSHMPRLGAGRAAQSEGVKPAGRLIDFFSRNSSSPSGPNSRPMPDSLKPPKGVEKSMGIGLFSM